MRWLPKSVKKWFGFEDRFAKKQKLKRFHRPTVEQLEDRTTPALLAVTGLGADGWFSDDTRSTGNFDMVGTISTHAGDAAITPTTADDLAIAQQLKFVSTGAFPGATYGGAVSLSGTTSNNGKTSISKIDTTTGLAAGSALIDSGFSASYQWLSQGTRTSPLKFGVQSTVFGVSQNAFTAQRSGESAWDLILVQDLTTPVSGVWNSTSATATTGKWFLFAQAGNSYMMTNYATGGLGGALGSRTLSEWNTLATSSSGVTWGDLLFDPGAKVTSVQFGVGSSQSNAVNLVDFLQVSFLNGGDVIDFGSVQTAYVDQASDFTLTFDADDNGFISAGDRVTWNPTGADHPEGTVENLTFGLNAFTSIQAGVDAVPSGGTVYIAAGTYTENVNVNKRVAIEGAGSSASETVVQSATIDVPIFNYTVGGLDAVNRQVLKDIRIQNGDSTTLGAQAGSGIVFATSTASGYFTLDNVTSRNNDGHGLVFNNSTNITDVVIEDSDFSDNQNGILIRGGGYLFDGLSITGSTFARNDVLGFSFNPNQNSSLNGTNFVISNTLFTENGDASYTQSPTPTPQLGRGDIGFQFYNGNATLTDVTVNGLATNGAHIGVQFRGDNTVAAAGNIVITNLTVTGSYLRPLNHTSDGGGPGGALFIQNYSDVSTISMANVNLLNTQGHQLFAAGLSNTLDLNDAEFGATLSNGAFHIALGTTTQNPTAGSSVDATGATFGVITAASATTTQAFDIVDKILDGVDTGGVLGFVQLTGCPESAHVARIAGGEIYGNNLNKETGHDAGTEALSQRHQ